MAFTPCTTAGLTTNVATICTEPRIKDYEQIGLAILKSDIDLAACTVDSANPRIIDNLALKEGKTAAVIYNSKKNPLPFNGTQTAYNRDTDHYDKIVQFYYEGIGGDAALDVVEPLKDGDYVVILERKHKSDNGGSFQMFGWQKGISAGNEGGAQVQDEETGYWLMTMTTEEPWAEIEWLDTDYATTKAAFDVLSAGK
jgi:hypothetical protein